MAKEYKAHPLMIFKLMTPFLFALLLPVIRAVIQYFRIGTIGRLFLIEAFFLAAIVAIAVGRWYAFKLVCDENKLSITTGIIIRTHSELDFAKLSSIQTVRTIPDFIFGTMTFRINTEAGSKGRSDFEFKLKLVDGRELSKRIYGVQKIKYQKYSALRVALLSIATSSAFMGLVVGIPVLNHAGNLFGVAINKILFDEINTVSSKIETKLPPIVNILAVVFLLSLAVSFVYQFLKFVEFKVVADENQIEVRCGLITKERTAFKRQSVNAVRIEQTPLMLLFNRHTLKASVGGFASGKKEAQVMVPIGKYEEMKNDLKEHFPFLAPKGKAFSPKRSFLNITRFLYWPNIFMICGIALSVILVKQFPRFSDFIIFLTYVGIAVDIYYGIVSYVEYKRSRVCLGDSVYLSSKFWLRPCEIYCQKEKIGAIKLVRVFTDFPYGTCKLRMTVCSEGADTIIVRHLNYETTRQEVFEAFGISE